MRAGIEFEDGSCPELCCTLGAEPAAGAHEHHFFGFYEGDIAEMAGLLAGLHHHHLRVAPIDVGHRVPIAPDNPLVVAGYTHLVADEPWMFWPLGSAFEVPADGLVPGCRVLAVMPVRAAELAVHRASGLSALLDARIANGETPLSIRLVDA